MTPAFAPFARKMRDAGLPEIAIDTFAHYYELLRSGVQGKVPRAEIDPVDDVPDAGTLGRYRAAGTEALGRAIVLKLNGGLGTSMGMTKAKSLLPVKQGLSFLDVIAKQTLHLRQLHGVRLPLVLMNSFRTRADSQQVLARYPALPSAVPPDFLQNKVPRILKADLTPVEWPADREHEWCPPGHGDLYTAIVTSGMLRTLLDQGFEYAFVSNADNLGAVLDLDILGFLAAEQIPFLMEVIDRTEADRKGGHLARRKDGRLLLREVAQCPDDEIESFQDVRVWRYFNANSLWVNLRTLDRVLHERRGVLGLPMITNEKPVDPDDPGSPRVLQLETAMGAAISVFEGAQALRVPRSRFVPVKTTSDLLVLWSDVYTLADDFRVVLSPARTGGAPFVDLDPKFFRRVADLEARVPDGAPSLLHCRRLVVRGDVRFAAGVVVEGEVVVQQDGAVPRVVPAGTRLVGA
ncbi:MAG: UTP--glucose-1-phosphate uridylyltransferase [Candidatus Binatia bacterium]